MQVVLVMFKADGERRSFSLARDVTILGRREDCDLRIPLGEVSRKHCRFIKDGNSLRLEDLGSSNGTLHNGQRIQEATVEPGDTVQVGPVTFVVQIDGEPADDQLQPVTAEDTAASAAAAADSSASVAAQAVPQEAPAEEAADGTIASDPADAFAHLTSDDSAAGQEESVMIDLDSANSPQAPEEQGRAES